MKKLILLGLALVAAFSGVQAQNENVDMFKARLEFHQRNAANKQLYGIPQAPQQADAKSAKGGVTMPQGSWFPGEWEEVQAIVSTVYYNYYPEDHVGQQAYTADPLLGGYAQLYQYQGGWNYYAMGRYVGIPDTSNQDFSKVFYYVIDAVQQGGAQSWVRVENLSDSAIVLRRLQSLGLRHDNVRFIEGYGNSFWYRDCGPIAFYYGDQDSIAMMDFMYYPGRALDDSLPYYIEQQMGIRNIPTTIEWEGGNCLVDGTGVVMSSDAIYSNNMDTRGQLEWNGTNPNTINYASKPSLTKQQVKDSLAHILGPRATYLLPTYKYDGGTGHIDLYADMIDENMFVFSVMPDRYSNWTDYKTGVKNIDSLTHYKSMFGNNYKQATIPFPCANNGAAFSSQVQYNNQYTRTYSNHTFVNNLIIQPVFSPVVDGQPTAQWDREKYDSLRLAYPGYTLYPINVASFDGSGGAIHCITKQIPAESPIRILHSSFTGLLPELNNGDAEVKALVTNNTGVAGVTCYYRVNDSDNWVEVPMNATGNNDEFAGAIPCAQILQGVNTSYAKIQYFISASSNGGKTITKPMPADQGGYYTFYVGSDFPVAIQEIADQKFGQFYPNPASAQANIEIDLGTGANYDVRIVDLMGRTAHHTQLQAEGNIIYTINTHSLSSGIYNVIFSGSNGERQIRRLVVK